MGLSNPRTSIISRFRKWLFAENAVYGRLFVSSLIGVGAIVLLASAFVTVALQAHREDVGRQRAVETVRRISAIENDLAHLVRDYHVYGFTRHVYFLENFHRRSESVNAGFGVLEQMATSDDGFLARIRESRKAVQRWLDTVALPAMNAQERGHSVPEISGGGDQLVEDARASLRRLQQKGQIEANAQRQLENQSFQALAFAPRLAGLFCDMERALWDYAITGAPESVVDYRAAAAEFESVFGYLSILLDGRGEPLKMIQDIHDCVGRWETGTAQEVIAERAENHEALGALLAGEAGAVEVRGLINEFEKKELARFEKANRRTQILRAARTGGFVGIAGLAILMLLGATGYSFLSYRRHLRKLEVAEAQTRSIIETTLDGVVTVDTQGTIRTINPAAEAMFGHSNEELVGKNVSKIIPQRLFLHDMSNVGHGTIMAMGQRQNFYPFPIEVSVSEIESEGDRHFVAIIRDVTERKRSEEILRHIGLGVSSATGEEFIRSLVVQLSKALQTDYALILQISGQNRETGHVLSLAEEGGIRSLPHYEMAGSACEEVVRRGFCAWSENVNAVFPEDDLLEELEAQSFVAMPLTDHRGRAIGVLGVADRKPMSDMQRVESTLQIFTARAGAEIERQQAAEDLAAEKERLSVTLQSISEGCVTVDMDGRVGLLNPAAERLTGWTQAHAVGRPLTDVLHVMNRGSRDSCREALEQLIRTGATTGLEASSILVAADGAERVVECSAAPIRDPGNRRIGVVIFFRDMTERERSDEERRKTEKLESLGVAAGGIAHDFNNLLTAILGNLSLAMMSQGPRETLHERLDVAKSAAVRAQDLAQQLLTFARGGAPVKKTESLVELIRETVTFALRGTKVRCEFDLPDDLWPAEIDTAQISQVLANIAQNADQAMSEGGTFHVSVSNFEQEESSDSSSNLAPGRYSSIVLRDEGEGIPPGNLTKIFDPYFSTRAEGSGLGLATAYSIIKSHGGLVTVDSTVGEGSVFCLYLPASEVKVPVSIIPEKPAPTGPGRVLVLDDEEVICELVSCTLEPMGYDVTEAYDAATAIRYYEEALEGKHPFDVVISDLTIPGGMGGQEAIKRLREIDPAVKAIVSSGYAMDPVMSRYQEYGFCACLAKPYEVAALGQLVDEVYGRTVDGSDGEVERSAQAVA